MVVQIHPVYPLSKLAQLVGPLLFNYTAHFWFSLMGQFRFHTCIDDCSHGYLPHWHIFTYISLFYLHFFVGESTRDTSSLTDSYSQNLPPRSATPDSPPQIPRVTFKPVVQDVPEMDEIPPPNTVVLSDLYALTTKVCLAWLCQSSLLSCQVSSLIQKLSTSIAEIDVPLVGTCRVPFFLHDTCKKERVEMQLRGGGVSRPSGLVRPICL